MKIERTTAIAFLVALGFVKAKGWEDEKIVERLAQVPDKVNPDDVPEGQEALYEKICDAKGKVELEGEASGPAPAKDKAKPAVKDKAKPAVKDKAKPAVKDKAAPTKDKSKPASEQADLPGVPPPAMKKNTIPTDALGAREGTYTAKVNAGITKEWQEVEEVAKVTGVPMVKTKDRIYSGVRAGHFEIRRSFCVRLAPPSSMKKE